MEARGRAGRRRGPAGPAAGALLPRDRGQLRVPGVLAVLPGRQHRVRGPRDRDHGHLAHRRARQPAGQRDGRRPGHLRAVPPALHRGPARPRRRRGRQHGLRLRVPAGRARHRRPVRARPDRRQHPAAHRGGGEAGLRLGHAARLEGRQRQRDERARHPGRLQARPLSGVPAAARPRLPRLQAGPGDRPHALGDPVPRATSAGPAATSRSRPPATPACRSGPRPTGRSRTPTWCSGTCSASTTSPGRRTGR